MAAAAHLESYFTDGLAQCSDTVGLEIETLFTNREGGANSLMSFRQSQRMFDGLVRRGWKAETTTPCGHVVALNDPEGNTCKYDAGHANIELATIPGEPRAVLGIARRLLSQLYAAAEDAEVSPYHGPIFECGSDTLIDLTERDKSWIELDGRHAFARIARIASFQLTAAVSLECAIDLVNRLHASIGFFRERYPQDRVWRDYLKCSRAGYRDDRFGGPSKFDSLSHYCEELSRHDVIFVGEQKLVPFEQVEDPDIGLFLRSVWWYFRLRRYGDQLCIEVRPNGRYDDGIIERQMHEICGMIEHPATVFG